MPLTFVACGKSKSGNNTNPSNTEEQPANPTNPTTPTEPTTPSEPTDPTDPDNPSEPVEPITPEEPEGYVLNAAEVKKIIESSTDKLDLFIDNLNKSEVLKDNSYSENVAMKTYPVLNYAYNPVLFYSISQNTFDVNKVYAHILQGSYKYFKISTNDDNDEFSIRMVSNKAQDFQFNKFTYFVNEGEIKSIKISHLDSQTQTGFKFFEASFDFENSKFITSYAVISDISTGYGVETDYPFDNLRVFIRDYCTKDKFALVLKSKGSYYFDEEIDFSETKSLDCLEYKLDDDNQNNDISQKLVSRYDNFDFLEAYDKFIEYDQLSKNSEITKEYYFTEDYFSMSEGYSRYRYNNDEFTFDMMG